ncbi:MAG: zinc ribbon domain-containing protein [Desulfobacteraceae bacterium]|nr:zinc ribbon domain-containing protein [Desulfobacteraceae bacterium]
MLYRDRRRNPWPRSGIPILRRCFVPTYEFVCEQCNKSFSVLLSLSDFQKKRYRCPRCKSKKLRQLITSFQAFTSKKS